MNKRFVLLMFAPLLGIGFGAWTYNGNLVFLLPISVLFLSVLAMAHDWDDKRSDREKRPWLYHGMPLNAD